MASHLFGFLKSLSEACILHFHFADHDICPRHLMHISRAQLLIFSVRTLETLMRDCLLTCAYHNDEFRNKIIGEKWSLNNSEFDVENKMHFEILFSKISTQNLESVEKYFGIFFGTPLFRKLFSGEPYITFQLDENDKLIGSRVEPENFIPDCRDNLFELFQYRHEVIHNGHFNLEMPDAQLKYFMEMALCFGQMLCLNVGNSLLEPTEDGSDGVRSGEALFAVKFSEYARFMLKATPPRSEDAEAKAVEIIRRHEYAEQQEGYPAPPKERMGLGPFFLTMKDLLRLNLEQGRRDGFDPTNSMHLFFLSDTGFLELSTLRRS